MSVGSGGEESSAVMALVSGAWPNPNNVDPKQQIAKTAATVKQVWHSGGKWCV